MTSITLNTPSRTEASGSHVGYARRCSSAISRCMLASITVHTGLLITSRSEHPRRASFLGALLNGP